MIYAIDFDGTIVYNNFPKIGPLNMAAEQFIKELKKRGDKWILYTMREGKVLDEALEFLKSKGLEPDAVNDNLPELKETYQNNPRKVFANVYIDDHNAGGLKFSVRNEVDLPNPEDLNCCVDCRFYTYYQSEHFCMKFRQHIDGEPIHCENARKSEYYCGTAARCFEHKEPAAEPPREKSFLQKLFNRKDK